MAYPEQSNFNSGGLDSAWWETSDGTTLRRCSTSGYTFVGTLQAVVKNQNPSGRSYDGVNISASEITIDRKWATKTQRGLWVVCSSLGAPSYLLDALAADGHASHLTGGSLAAATWFLARIGLAGRGVPRLPSDVVAPRWGIAPPIPMGWTPADTFHCIGDVPSVDVPVENPPVDDGSGVENPPVNPPVIPPGVTPPTTTQRAGVPWSLILFVAAGVSLVAITAFSLRNAASPRSRRTKRPRRIGAPRAQRSAS